MTTIKLTCPCPVAMLAVIDITGLRSFTFRAVAVMSNTGRVADILEGKETAGIFTAPINSYGEGIGEAIQNQM